MFQTFIFTHTTPSPPLFFFIRFVSDRDDVSILLVFERLWIVVSKLHINDLHMNIHVCIYTLIHIHRHVCIGIFISVYTCLCMLLNVPLKLFDYRCYPLKFLRKESSTNSRSSFIGRSFPFFLWESTTTLYVYEISTGYLRLGED